MRPPYRRPRRPRPGRSPDRSRPVHRGVTGRPAAPHPRARPWSASNSLTMPAPTPRISVASPTGQQWRIGHGRQEVVVCEVGATLRAYSVGDHAVLDGFGSDEWSHSGRGQVLAPWPNRLADGRYEFNGVRAQAALDEPERRNAIHGLVRWMPWTLQTRHQNQLSLRLQLHPVAGLSVLAPARARLPRGPRGPDRHDDGAVPRRGRPSPSASASTPTSPAGPGTVDGAILHLPGAPHPRPRRPRSPDRRADPRRGHRTRLHHVALRGARRCSTRPTPPWSATPTGRPGPRLDAPGGATGAALWVDPGFPYLMVYTGDTLPDVPRRRRGRRHRAHDLPAQRAADRQGRDRPAARAAMDGRVGGSSPGDGARCAALLSTARSSRSPARRAASAPPRRVRSPRPVRRCSSTRRTRSRRARRSPPRCPTPRYVQGDITDPAFPGRLVAAALERWGRLDTLVNNAGTTAVIPHHDVAAAIRRRVAADLRGQRLRDVGHDGGRPPGAPRGPRARW